MNLKKVAELAHMSVSTVSRALNDSFDVAPETREYILKIAEESDYFNQKKHIKQGNRRKGRVRAAILCPEIISPYYSAIAEKIISALRVRGANGIVYNYNFDSELQKELLALCINSPDCDAVICLGELDSVENCTETQIISFSPLSGSGQLVSRIDSAVRQAAEHLISIKRTRLAYAGERLTASKGEFFKNACEEFGIMPYSFFTSSERFEEAGVAAAEFFMRHGLPDGIVCAYDSVAIGLISVLKSRGISVPETVSVVGINDIPTAKYVFGGLTTISVGCESAVDALVDDILKTATKNRQYVFEPRLITRNT